MDRKQIDHLLNNCNLPDSCENTDFITTHISWVILTDHYAFKIKRPVKYSFLDFSSPEKRKFFCHEELRLNRRLAPEMYIRVWPIEEKAIKEDGKNDKVVDYAVQMQRKDNNKEMDNLLKENNVDRNQTEKLAKTIVDFHRQARVVKNAFDTMGLQKEYEDINTEINRVRKGLGENYVEKVNTAIKKSYNYLNSIRSYSNERVISGFRKDCHGDLNAHNIFLYDEPLIFDCIEFNQAYREIDILNDIAFLCVDFDFFDHRQLGKYFYKKYLEHYPLKDETKSRKLFVFYKSYRANIRAKVNLINAGKTKGNSRSISVEKAGKYIDLMHRYMNEIQT